MHYLKCGYVIQLIAFRWDTACIRSSPDPLPSFAEVGRACETRFEATRTAEDKLSKSVHETSSGGVDGIPSVASTLLLSLSRLMLLLTLPEELVVDPPVSSSHQSH